MYYEIDIEKVTNKIPNSTIPLKFAASSSAQPLNFPAYFSAGTVAAEDEQNWLIPIAYWMRSFAARRASFFFHQFDNLNPLVESKANVRLFGHYFLDQTSTKAKQQLKVEVGKDIRWTTHFVTDKKFRAERIRTYFNIHISVLNKFIWVVFHFVFALDKFRLIQN